MSTFLLLFFGAPVLFSTVLALPPALSQRSWRRFLIALGLSFVTVVLPLWVFLLSSFLLPDWKGACPHGWVDCFIVGKLALTPLALVATAALYSVEVLRVEQRTRTWIVVGIVFGALVSVACLVFVFGCLKLDSGGEFIFMLVPGYIALWYSIRAAQLLRAAGLGLKTRLGALCGTLPFWLGSIFWSRNAYASLPDEPPNCFIVTAAGRGHRRLVRPDFEIWHHGRQIHANQQLITLWQFENLWRTHAPRSHRHFRRLYNCVGPAIAAQIKSPWLADLAYVAIKPPELMARLIVTINNKRDPRK